MLVPKQAPVTHSNVKTLSCKYKISFLAFCTDWFPNFCAIIILTALSKEFGELGPC